MIQIDDKLFLESFEMFQRVILPLINIQRKIDGLSEIKDPDDVTNTFLELREQYGIKGDGIHASGTTK